MLDHRKASALFLVVAAVAAAGCSGGDGGSGPLPNFLGYIEIDYKPAGLFSVDLNTFAAFGDEAQFQPTHALLPGECVDLSGETPSTYVVVFEPAEFEGSAVSITGPAGSWEIPATGFPSDEPDPSYFVPGGTYDVEIAGSSSIGAQSVQIEAPDFLGAVTAGVESGGELHIDRSQDLVFTWSSAGTPILIASVEQEGGGSTLAHGVQCAFADDGSGVIPASMLAPLAPGDAIVSFRRRNEVSFDAEQNLTGPIRMDVEWRTAMTVD